MAIVISGDECAARLSDQISNLRALKRQRLAIESQSRQMENAGYASGAIATVINALLTDWGTLRDQIVTELTALPLVYQAKASIGMPALYTSAVIDAADSANAGEATIRVNVDSETIVSPFSVFTAGDIISISNAEDPENDISAVVRYTPHATPRADLISNGTFATDTLWTKGADWTIAAGVANAASTTNTALKSGTGGGTAMTTAWTAGQYYLVTYTITISAGYLNIGTNTTTGQASATVAGAAKTAIILADGHSDGLTFTGVGFTGTLDSVSVIPFTGLALDRSLGADNSADTSLVVTLQER
jgi:hypothetical protein